MSTTTVSAQRGATAFKTSFHKETTTSPDIKVTPAIVWALLTKASYYTRWNSTVTSINGNIELGSTKKLIATLERFGFSNKARTTVLNRFIG